MSKCVICFWCPRCPSSQEPKDAETGATTATAGGTTRPPRSGIRLMRFTVAKFVRNETVSKSFTVFLGRCQEYVTWKASWNLGPSLRHPQILRLLFRCHDTSAAHGCSHSFSVRVSLSLQLQSAGVNDVHVLLWRFWPTRRVFSDRWAMNTGNFWDQITSSRHITAEFCGFVGQRPSSRLKWGTLHSELKLSMSTLSVATCDSFWHTWLSLTILFLQSGASVWRFLKLCPVTLALFGLCPGSVTNSGADADASDSEESPSSSDSDDKEVSVSVSQEVVHCLWDPHSTGGSDRRLNNYFIIISCPLPRTIENLTALSLFPQTFPQSAAEVQNGRRLWRPWYFLGACFAVSNPSSNSIDL